MGRIDRRNFQYALLDKGSLPDLMDGFFQLIFRLDELQTNQILDSLSDDEVIYLTRDFSSFAAKREFISWLEVKVQRKK